MPKATKLFSKLLGKAVSLGSMEHCHIWMTNLLSEDVLGLENHIESYLSQSQYPLLMINFDSFLNSSIPDALAFFLQLDDGFIEEGISFPAIPSTHNDAGRCR